MSGADLRNAKLPGVNFTDAGFVFTNLRAPICTMPTWKPPGLTDADLRAQTCAASSFAIPPSTAPTFAMPIWSNLIDWQLIRSVDGANILNVKNAPRGFADWARQHGAMEISDDA